MHKTIIESGELAEAGKAFHREELIRLLDEQEVAFDKALEKADANAIAKIQTEIVTTKAKLAALEPKATPEEKKLAMELEDMEEADNLTKKLHGGIH